MSGADTGFLKGAVKYSTPAIILFIILLLFIYVFLNRLCKKVDFDVIFSIERHTFRIQIATVIWVCILICNILGSIKILYDTNDMLQVTDYVSNLMNESTIFEDYYVEPDIDSIVATENKNLIYIYHVE